MKKYDYSKLEKRCIRIMYPIYASGEGQNKDVCINYLRNFAQNIFTKEFCEHIYNLCREKFKE